MEQLALSRRDMMAAATAAASTPVSRRIPRARKCNAWDLALSNYSFARRRHLTFLEQVLDPTVREAAARGEGLTDEIIRLEEEGNDLCSARYDALREFMTVPAGDLEALRLKFRLAYEDMFRFDDNQRYLGALLADLDRLLG